MMLSVVVGAACALVLWLLDIHLSLLFGSVHFVLNFIPSGESSRPLSIPHAVVFSIES